MAGNRYAVFTFSTAEGDKQVANLVVDVIRLVHGWVVRLGRTPRETSLIASHQLPRRAGAAFNLAAKSLSASPLSMTLPSLRRVYGRATLPRVLEKRAKVGRA
jgi:hypothetical protein